jgi:curli biogenesis system outer membrane secretion channel CsgG
MNYRNMMYRISGVLVLLLGMSFSARADYVAYGSVENRPVPLPRNIDDIEAKYLVNMTWGRANANRIRVGVLKVQNTSGASTGVGDGTAAASSGTVPVNAIEAITTTIMQKSGRFRVFERSALKSVLREQDLGTSGRISKPSAAKVGKLLGVQYLVKVEVTHYEPNYKGKSFGLGGALKRIPILGGISKKSARSMVGMNFRLINATTGEVIYTKQVKSIMTSSGLDIKLGAANGLGSELTGGLGAFYKSYSKLPIGQAVIATINKGIFSLVQKIGSEPVKGAVSRVKGRQVYLNLGRGRVRVGDRLKVVSKGEKVVDPTTGEVLGSEDEAIGTVVITKVRKRYSIARVSGPIKGQIKIRDEVVSLRTPAPLRYAPGWQASGGGGHSSGGGKSSPSSSDDDEDDDF